MRNFTQRLKIIFASNKLFNTYNLKNVTYLLLVYIILLIYVLLYGYYLLLIPLVILFIILFFKNKLLWIICLCSTIISSVNILPFVIKTNERSEGIEGTFVVYKTTNYADYKRIDIKDGYYKYYFNQSNEDNPLNTGDVIYITGVKTLASGETIPHGFSYKKYLLNNKIVGKIKVDKISYLRNKFTIYKIHETILNHLKRTYPANVREILGALTIGEKIKDDQSLSENIRLIGISHLFVISGLHIGIISNVLSKVLKKVKAKNYIILLVLLSYYLISYMMVSILRVIISFVLSKVLGKYFKHLHALDLFFLNAFICLLINPFYLFSYSFKLSYIVVFGIILISDKMIKKTLFAPFINNAMTSLTSQLISMPIILSIYPKINFLSVLYNLFFIPFVTYVMLPLSFIVLIFPKITSIYAFVCVFFTSSLKILNNITFATFRLSPFNVVFGLLYYLTFIFMIKSKKKLIKLISAISFILVITLNNTTINFDLNDEIYFFDLQVGESTLIKAHHNKANILIDTGESSEDIIKFLTYKRIQRIDAIFISHGDYDHLGGVNDLINNFNVKQIYIPFYDDKSILYFEGYSNINYLKAGDVVKIKDITFNILWPKEKHPSCNNNSLVMDVEINNYHLLFTGDIEKEAELKLLNSLPSIDILKVAHHGSNTSSTYEFLIKANPTISIAMNGHNNRFGFPSKTICDRFEMLNIPMYNTLNHGTIYLKKKYYQKTYKLYLLTN